MSAELNPKRIIPVGPGYDWSDRSGISTHGALDWD
jgi:hypothetical protein